MFGCALVIIFLLLYKCVLVYSITIYAISAYRVLSRCVLIGETMTRTSNDEYQNGKLWNGYDYQNQCWVHEGKPDTRTIEELQNAIMEA